MSEPGRFPLHRALTEHPKGPPLDSDAVLERFLDYATEQGLTLYPAQEEAILELYSGKNLILNTPTGSGKSLVAAALHFQSLAGGRRSFYTSPIKALVNEKFLALCRDFGPDQVGMITGDGSVNPGAPIICCTAEILANDALRLGSLAQVDDVIMDEFHFYSDRERGWAWQVPILALPQARFLLLSATLGDTARFEEALTQLNGRETVVIKNAQRPVPLEYEYSEEPLHAVLPRLVTRGRSPVYLVNFTQAACAEEAQNLLSLDFCTREEKARIAREMEGTSFQSPYGKEFQRVLKHGIGIHHAGLLPRYRMLVERLAQKGLLKIICGTDTLGVGVNVPIRTVLFTKLCKYDGEKTALLTVRDFQQIAGRAGRKGFDDLGTVVCQAPEHVIENMEMERKAAGDPKKQKKIVKRKPPEKGYVHWDKTVFERLTRSEPETLQSRFDLSHGVLLQLLSRTQEDGCLATRKLIRACHESDRQKQRLRAHGFELFRTLVDRKIVRILPSDERTGALKVALNVELQQDFSLHKTLSLYLIDTLPLLDRESPDYSLDLLTLVESILENPDAILRRQVDRLKTEKLYELKAQGMEYEERMEELEKIEHPKPNRDFIYRTFNAFSAAHPWVGQENIRPKSIAREMAESFMSFSEMIRETGLQRSEGLLLRYLSDTFRTLSQTVPENFKTDDVLAIEEYLRSTIRQIDSSLIDEWEKLRSGQAPIREGSGQGQAEARALAQKTEKEWLIRVRNAVFRLVRALSQKDFEEASSILLELDSESTWSPDQLEKGLAPYFTERTKILTDGNARSPARCKIEEDSVTQTLLDPEGHHDAELSFSWNKTQVLQQGLLKLSFQGLKIC